jgi:hypothetical protein
MRARLTAALLLLLVTTPGLAQDAPPPKRDRAPERGERGQRERGEGGERGERRKLKAEEKARLLERYRSLPPEERTRLRRLYDEHVRGRDPEELERLRGELRQRVPRERADAAPKRERFRQRPQDEQLRYERLHHRLLQQLPPEERREVLQLDPEKRRARLDRMVQQHRRRVVESRVRHLPGQVREQVEAELANLQGKERFRRAREAVEGHAREELRRIYSDDSLSNQQKARRVREILSRFIPEQERREQLQRKILGELERRRPDRRRPDRPRPDDGQPADRPGAPDGERPQRPQRPKRGQQ